jgi:hypothetical protein
MSCCCFLVVAFESASQVLNQLKLFESGQICESELVAGGEQHAHNIQNSKVGF